MFVLLQKVRLAIIEPNHRLNTINNLQSRPAIKIITTCIDNPLNKQACFVYFLNISTLHTQTDPISPLNSRIRAGLSKCYFIDLLQSHTLKIIC